MGSLWGQRNFTLYRYRESVKSLRLLLFERAPAFLCHLIIKHHLLRPTLRNRQVPRRGPRPALNRPRTYLRHAAIFLRHGNLVLID